MPAVLAPPRGEAEMAQLAQVLGAYLAEEDSHKHSARHQEAASGERKFALF